MKQTSQNNENSTEDKNYKTKAQMSKYPRHSAKICKMKIISSTQFQSLSQTTTTANTHRKNRFPGQEYFKLPETLQKSIAIVDIPAISHTPNTNSKTYTYISRHQQTSPKTRSMSRGGLCRVLQCLLPILLLAVLKSTNVVYATEQSSRVLNMPRTIYSQPLTTEDSDDSSFRPIIPKDVNLESISQNIFTKRGHYRVFEPAESDLRATVSMRRETTLNDTETTTLESKSLSSVDQPSGITKLPHTMAEATKPEKEVVEITNIKQNLQTIPQKNEVRTQQVASKQVRFTQQHPPNPIKRAYTTPESAPVPISNQQQSLDDIRPLSAAIGSKATPTQHSQGATLATEMKGLENLLSEYVNNFFNKGQYQPKPELIIALQQNYTEMKQNYDQNVGALFPQAQKPRHVRQAVTKRAGGELTFSIPRALESGRLLFFAGLKKILWPLYMGLQILKSLMFALLLPTLIGSFGKLLGKGISSGSAPLFIRPMDEPQDLDFKDNNFNFDDESNKFTLMEDAKDAGYAYNQAEASQTHNQYAYNGGNFGMNERQQQLMQDSYLGALQSLSSASFKNSNGLSAGSSGGGNGLAGLTTPVRQKPASPANTNTFQQFQKVPASSLLLSNYDPFYSPLLSRLDSVFAQLKLNSDDEACREKLICLMYANPAKYAPYSNLVSAQLSRELNELRKPTSDNPDILRFFKYMRAAKDGQDGIDCEKSFEKCKEFKDFENPAMVSTYHDINKLVQARKFA